MRTFNSIKIVALTTLICALPLSLHAGDDKDMKEIAAPVAPADPDSISFFAGPYYYFTPKTPIGTDGFFATGSSQSAGPVTIDSSGLGFMVGSAGHLTLDHEDFADSFDPKVTFWQVENDNVLANRPAVQFNFLGTGAIVSHPSGYYYSVFDGYTSASFKTTTSDVDLDLLLTKKLFTSDNYTLSLLYGISIGYYSSVIKEDISGSDITVLPGGTSTETGNYQTSSLRLGPSLGFNNSFKLPLDSTLDFSALARLYFGANNLSGSQNVFNNDGRESVTTGNYANGDSNATFSPQLLANLKWTLPIDEKWSFYVDGTGTMFINTPTAQFPEPNIVSGNNTNLNDTKFGLMSETTWGASADAGFKFNF